MNDSLRIHCLIILGLLAPAAPAAERIWDTIQGDGAAVTDGGGTWSNATGNWNNGAGDATWNNTAPDSATFTGTTGGTITVSGGVTQGGMIFNGDANYTVAGASIGGAGSLTKNGTGILTLASANSFTGGTTVSAGTLKLNAVNASGTGAIILGNANTGSNHVALDLTNHPIYANLFTRNVTVANLGTGLVTIKLGAANFVSTSTFTLNRPTTFAANNTGNTYVGASFSSGGLVTGPVGTLTLTENGTGAIVWGHYAANTYTGTTLITAGKVGAYTNAAFGSRDNPLTLQGTAKLEIDNNGSAGALTVGDLTGAPTTTISTSTFAGAGTRSLTINQNGDSEFAGVITQAAVAQSLSLTKTGAGRLTLSGANTYSGTTSVDGGTLEVASSGTLPAGTVTVHANATLSGTGSIGGAVALQAGGHLKPAGDGIGTLTIHGPMSLGGNVHLGIHKSGATLTGDRIAGPGSLTLSGSLIVTASGDAPAFGDTFTLLTNTGSRGFAGTTVLPALPSGLFWDLSTLMTDGAIRVTDVPGAPSFSLPSGSYVGSPQVTIVGPPGAMIYYTVDGSEPTLDSAHGSSPLALVVPGDVTGFTIKAFAKTASSAAGPVATAIYTTIANPAVRIHEILAVPTDASQLRDENGLAQDWIELRNDMAVPISIAGWTLTDNAGVPAKWTFPATASIPAGGFYLVFASGTGASPFGGIPHTNFSLGQGGERLRLIRPDGVVASQVDFPAQYPNVTWGASPDGVASGWLLSPTPGAPNSALAAGGACEVSFSVPHGFFTSAFPLTLAPSVAGATIHYTLDGSTPTTSSPVYDGPLAITPVAGTTKSGTRIVRAMATHPAVPWCPVASQTYLFVQGVAGRDTDGIIGQTQLIASIKNHATYGPLLEDAFLALPAVSIVSSASDLPYEETASSIELFAPDGREAGFTIPAGLERTGTTSINFAKASLSAKFRGKYGATSLKYPVFAGYPHAGNGAATEFQELRIRSGSHDTHQFLGTAGDPFIPYRSITRSGDAQYIRNIWIDDMQFLMGQPGKHGRMVHLFFNGSYYGIYHLHERPDENHMAAYFPGKAEDYHYTVSARSGSTHGAESWSAPWAQLKASLADYGQAKRWVDMTNLIDYMILGFYAGNDWDWLVNHNWSAAGPRLPDRGGWKFFTQDQDMCLQDVTADNSNLSLTNKNLPDGVFGALMVHPDFQVLFRDRAYRHLFHEGALTPAKAASYYDLRANEIQTAIIAETARWQPVTSVGPLPWDRDGEWTVERNYLMNTYFPQRSAVQMNQFRSRGWYPVEAPEISQRGGAVAPGSSISLSGPGGATIYYTLDGSDPRLPGGAVSPTALAHLNPPPQTFVAPGNDVPGQGATWRYLVSAAAPAESWKTAAHDDSSWPSGKPELGYGDGDEVTNFGSIDIDPGTPGIQRPITNYFRHSFSATADISGLTLRVKRDDGIIVYLNGQEIFRNNLPEGPVSHNTTATNAADDGEAWFTKTLGAGEFTLLTGQNLIAAEVHNSSATSSDISFDLELIGSSTASGPSVTINSPTTLKARALVGTEWSAVNEATFYLTGTQPASAANLTLTEIHYHPEGSGQGDAEFLEFTNTGETAINLDGVRIVSGVVFSFPQDIFLLPGERLVVAKDQSLFDARYRQVSSPWYFPNIRLAGLYTGSLSNAGEEIAVRDANNAAIFSFRYDDEGAWPGRADERGSSLELSAPAAAPGTLAEKSLYLGNPANWRPSAEFHGSPGRQGSGPDQRVLINEVLSAPLPPLTDFIELYNPGTSSQPMGGWFLSDTSADYRKFRIPADTNLAAQSFLVLDESQFNNTADPGCMSPFALSSGGDDVYLLEADTAGNLLKFIDRVEFGPAPGGMSFGRAPENAGAFDLASAATRGEPNSQHLPEYAAWVGLWFPAGTAAADTALAADPDRDGLNNLAEFALLLSPLHPDTNPLKLLPTAPGSPIEISFSVRNDIPALRARLHVSTDLENWDDSEAFIQRLSETPTPDGTTTVTARLINHPASPRAFIRLAIDL